MNNQDAFIAKHKEALTLRKRVEQLRYDLRIAESYLRDAERESSVMFHNLFDRTAVVKKTPPPKAAPRDWHYDSQGYCDNPGRGY